MKKKQNSSVSEITYTNNVLLCFSHLRWNFVYQRPQHLMSRFAKIYKVYFIEEPEWHDNADTYDIYCSPENVWVVKPLLQKGDTTKRSTVTRQKIVLDTLLKDEGIQQFVSWYYTPMAMKFSSHLKPDIIIYDCMDELSAFKFAPSELKLLEAELFKKSNVVFTGGHCLYEAKKQGHHNIHPFPSSIDKAHFAQARTVKQDPADQENIPAMRFGFYGVIDERFDIKLIEQVATKRPGWQIILIGPVVKIDEATLPRLSNIHYLGAKSYNELPHYLAGWDVAMIPFEKNESTRFISPTKTPEYLAGGKPVISSSITDVVTPYSERNLVRIADDADSFIGAAEEILSRNKAQKQQWLKEVDDFLADNSWDLTVLKMLQCINNCSSNVVSTQELKSVA